MPLASRVDVLALGIGNTVDLLQSLRGSVDATSEKVNLTHFDLRTYAPLFPT